MIRSLSAEALGTAILLIAAVGSAAMAGAISGGNAGIALLASSVATGATLFVLITIFGPISGAHLNPAVTLLFALTGRIDWRTALGYVAVQVIAAIVGIWIVHAMFGLDLLQVATTPRSGGGQFIAEMIATFGLLLTILGGLAHAPDKVAALVGCYITGAYWFTSSTSFANPAVSIARGLTDTPAGIAPAGIPSFVIAEIAAAVLAGILLPRLFSR